MGLRKRKSLSRKLNRLSGILPNFLPSRTPFVLEMLLGEYRYIHSPSPLSGLRNPPRPILVAGSSSTGSSDSDGGLFAVPTTLPPNSRHGKLFSPNKETELTFLQHLNSISVSAGTVPLCLRADPCLLWKHSQGSGAVFLTDAVGFLLAKAPEVAEPAPTEAAGGPGQEPWSGLRGWPPTGQAARHWFSLVSWVFTWNGESLTLSFFFRIG